MCLLMSLAHSQHHSTKEFDVKKRFAASLLVAGMALGNIAHAAPELLNVSYDVMRDFYKDYNFAF